MKRLILIGAIFLGGCADVAPTMPQENPVPGSQLSSGYGLREMDPIKGYTPGAHHDGFDLAAKAGEPIHPSRDGKVIYTGTIAGYGNVVVLDHGDGFTTLYGHAQKIKAKVGQVVTTKSVIATVGSSGRSTGPHLHYELRKNGVSVDPVGFSPPASVARLPAPPRVAKRPTSIKPKQPAKRITQTPRQVSSPSIIKSYKRQEKRNDKSRKGLATLSGNRGTQGGVSGVRTSEKRPSRI